MPRFSLRSFHGSTNTITGSISRTHPNTIETEFLLTWNDLPKIPERRDTGQRKDELWKSTCFELFLSHSDSPRYVEFNMSPSTDWNIYYFDSYRVASNHGFSEDDVQTQFIQAETSLRMTGTLRFDENWIGNAPRIGVSSIVDCHGRLEYWSLSHGEKSDFHDVQHFSLGW